MKKSPSKKEYKLALENAAYMINHTRGCLDLKWDCPKKSEVKGCEECIINHLFKMVEEGVLFEQNL